MEEYKHGISITEVATKSVETGKSEAIIPVFVGIAPTNLVNTTAVNTPILINSIDEAKEKIGYIDNFEKYTLCEAVKASFYLSKIAPIIVINVLDKTKHIAAVTESEYAVINKKITLDKEIIKESVVIKNMENNTEYEENEDYTLNYNVEGNLIVEVLTDFTQCKISYNKLDIEAITEEEILDGIEKVKEVYPKFNLVPGIIAVPGYSSQEKVKDKLMQITENINGLFSAITVLDIDTSEIQNIKSVIEYKTKNVWDKNSILVFPKVKYQNQIYNMSTIATCLMIETDIKNDSIPYVSPSNKSINADEIVLEDGSEIIIDYENANKLNANGICTVLNMQGFKFWGNNTAAYPENTDIKDRYIPIRRMFNWWKNSFIQRYFERIDNPLNIKMIEALINDENIRANGFKSAMQIAEAKIEYKPEDNPQENLINGRIKFREILVPFPPAESIENVIEFDTESLVQSINGGEQ